MTIKKFVAGSMFSMLLGSEMAAADWGDVYYCQQTNSLGITLGGEMTRYKPEKFQFKLDQTKNAMVYGSTGYFEDTVQELTKGLNWPDIERWYSSDQYSVTHFSEGKFLYTFNSSEGMVVFSADCDKF